VEILAVRIVGIKAEISVQKVLKIRRLHGLETIVFKIEIKDFCFIDAAL
jgi:hypothetical protein